MNKNKKRYDKYKKFDVVYADFGRNPHGVQGGIRAYASATIAGCFAVRGIKIVEGGKDGLFMSMPSRKTQDGYKDICFPVTEEFRNELKQAELEDA
jgi:stage V sporulation protein G